MPLHTLLTPVSVKHEVVTWLYCWQLELQATLQHIHGGNEPTLSDISTSQYPGGTTKKVPTPAISSLVPVNNCLLSLHSCDTTSRSPRPQPLHQGGALWVRELPELN